VPHNRHRRTDYGRAAFGEALLTSKEFCGLTKEGFRLMMFLIPCLARHRSRLTVATGISRALLICAGFAPSNHKRNIFEICQAGYEPRVLLRQPLLADKPSSGFKSGYADKSYPGTSGGLFFAQPFP